MTWLARARRSYVDMDSDSDAQLRQDGHSWTQVVSNSDYDIGYQSLIEATPLTGKENQSTPPA